MIGWCKEMSISRYYHTCQRGIGRPVHIRTFDGQIHRGVIERVSPNKVYLRPLRRTPNYGGYGYGFYGGYGGGWGFGWGVALGAIAALAFIPFFI